MKRLYLPSADISTTGSCRAICTCPIVYDAIGNVSSRQDVTLSDVEGFTYDSLNRLTQTQLMETGFSPLTTTYGYDALGDLTSKSDVGTYTYPYTDANGTKPHAVPSDGTNSYTCDKNGNLTSGAGRTVTWASYNLPITIL